jgi:hypothetical protein
MKLNRKQRRALVRQFKHEISVLLHHAERGKQQRKARGEREMRKRVGVIANAQWLREHPEYGNEVRLVDRGGSQKTHRERRRSRLRQQTTPFDDPAESHIGD